MKLRKLISVSLVASIVGNVNLASYASVLSEDTRYETFNSQILKIDDIRENDSVEVEIEGKTYKNIFDYSMMSSLNGTPNNMGFSLSGRNLTRNYDQISSEITIDTSWESGDYILKQGKSYTFVVDIIENTVDNEVEIFPCTWMYTEKRKGNVNVERGYIGRKILSVKCEDKDGRLYLLHDNINKPRTGTITISNIMVLEGDYYDEFTSGGVNTPDYFEGIQSVGESSFNGKMNIVSQNKNLIDIERHTKLINTGEYIETTTNSNEGVSYQLKPNTNYTLSFKKYGTNDCWVAVTVNGMYTNNNNDDYNRTFKTGADGVLNISIRANTARDIGHKFYDLMLEEGIIRTEYSEKYIDKQTIDLKEPLRAVPDGLSDKIIKKDGKWYIKRVLGERTFNGSENWMVHGNLNSSDIDYFVLANSHSSKVDINANAPTILTDKFMSVGRSYFATNTTTEGISLHSDTNGGLESWYSVGIKKSRLASSDATGFKTWLSNNPIKVIYPLDNPVYEPINYSPLTLYSDTTHIKTDSNIQPVLKVIVDRVLNRAMDYTEIALNTSKESDLSKARYWTNLLEETVKKDELQDQLNGITDIDMSIDKKTVSSNVDLYIKSNNTLSMSLSTNSIVFDDYSSVSDLEKLNAVDVTINSSLPYDLNAYLETPILSINGNNTLESNTLNIRETGDTYKPFINTVDKVILKEDCNAGNGNIHKIDLKLSKNTTDMADTYKTTVKFEAVQK